jgi:hypothetical protein
LLKAKLEVWEAKKRRINEQAKAEDCRDSWISSSSYPVRIVVCVKHCSNEISCCYTPLLDRSFS